MKRLSNTHVLSILLVISLVAIGCSSDRITGPADDDLNVKSSRQISHDPSVTVDLGANGTSGVGYLTAADELLQASLRGTQMANISWKQDYGVPSGTVRGLGLSIDLVLDVYPTVTTNTYRYDDDSRACVIGRNYSVSAVNSNPGYYRYVRISATAVGGI